MGIQALKEKLKGMKWVVNSPPDKKLSSQRKFTIEILVKPMNRGKKTQCLLNPTAVIKTLNVGEKCVMSLFAGFEADRENSLLLQDGEEALAPSIGTGHKSPENFV